MPGYPKLHLGSSKPDSTLLTAVMADSSGKELLRAALVTYTPAEVGYEAGFVGFEGPVGVAAGTGGAPYGPGSAGEEIRLDPGAVVAAVGDDCVVLVEGGWTKWLDGVGGDCDGVGDGVEGDVGVD